MHLCRCVCLGVALALAAGVSLPGEQEKKKKKSKEDEEPPTQVLELPQEPPAAVVAELQRLSFGVAPVSGKRLLSQQVRDGLRALGRIHRGAPVVKLRAFVAGNGDLRRVQAIVSEEFSERRQPLPVLTVVQVGGLLGLETQVVLESVAVEKKPVNPHGLAFLSGQQVTEPDVTKPAGPLLQQSLARLTEAAKAAGAGTGDLLRVTCFVSSLDDGTLTDTPVKAAFPTAAVTLVQTQRGPTQGVAECEGVARLKATPASEVVLVNPSGLASSPNYSQVALVKASKVVLSGSQLGFGTRDEDVRLALQRLDKALEPFGAGLERAVMVSTYPLTNGTVERVRRLRFEFLDRTRPPASTLLLFEGLPGLDAAFGMDVVAVAK